MSEDILKSACERVRKRGCRRLHRLIGNPSERAVKTTEIGADLRALGGICKNFYLVSNLGCNDLRLRVIEDECSRARSVGALNLIDLFQERSNSIWIVPSGDQTYRHETCFEFLIPAVTQEWGVEPTRNSQLGHLFFPNFRYIQP